MADEHRIIVARSFEVVDGVRIATDFAAIPRDECIGPRGVHGAEGPEGPRGPIGPRGQQGVEGNTGDVGPEGPQGESGAVGARGPVGLTGAVSTAPGPQGARGPQGVQGIRGEEGAASTIAGPQGANGPPGPQGSQGAKGDIGATGAQGLRGLQGVTGPRGVEGDPSTVPGPQGANGPIGPQGIQGAKGPKGSDGPEGPRGTRGLRGYTGDTGASGTGAQGPAGQQGAAGPGGPAGLDGDAGAAGAAGGAGPQGPAGPQGDAGADSTVPGPQGDDGPQGPAGPGGQGGGQGPQGPAGPTTWAGITDKPATFAPIIGGGAGDAVAGNDARLADSRTPLAHALVGALHTLAGGTAGFVLRAIDATSFAWARLNHSDLNLDATHPNDHANVILTHGDAAHNALTYEASGAAATHAGVSASSTHGSLGHANTLDHAAAHAIDGANHTGTLSDAQIPAGVARDSEVTAAVDAHKADATDVHGQYVKESDANWTDLTDAGATTLHSHAGGAGGDVVYTPTAGDTAVNVTADATIVTRDVTGVAAGDQVIVDAWFTILNNSTATRVYAITLDFDALFDIEISTGACAFSATLMHPFHVTAVCNVRSTSLAYAMVEVQGQLAAGIASGTDTTMAATSLSGMGWATSGSNATGTLTVALKVRSAAVTATQTLRLHHFTIRKVTPT